MTSTKRPPLMVPERFSRHRKRSGNPGFVSELLDRIPDFGRAYEPDGLAIDEFDTFGPSVRTLRAFIGSYHELLHQVSDALLPNPDLPA